MENGGDAISAGFNMAENTNPSGARINISGGTTSINIYESGTGLRAGNHAYPNDTKGNSSINVHNESLNINIHGNGTGIKSGHTCYTDDDDYFGESSGDSSIAITGTNTKITMAQSGTTAIEAGHQNPSSKGEATISITNGSTTIDMKNGGTGLKTISKDGTISLDGDTVITMKEGNNAVDAQSGNISINSSKKTYHPDHREHQFNK